MRHFGGVESSKDLTLAGFEDVMGYFNNCGFRSSWLERTYGHRDGMATPKQIDLIRTMWADYTGVDSDMDLNAWLENSFKVSALRFVDTNVAGKAITALKHMTARKKRKRSNIRREHLFECLCCIPFEKNCSTL